MNPDLATAMVPYSISNVFPDSDLVCEIVKNGKVIKTIALPNKVLDPDKYGLGVWDTSSADGFLEINGWNRVTDWTLGEESILFAKVDEVV